jgi:hypothetical protein
MVQLSWNIKTQETRSMVSTQLIANPKEAVEKEAIMAVMAAKVVTEEMEEANLAMSLMALMSPIRIRVLQHKNGRLWTPTMDATLCCRCKNA